MSSLPTGTTPLPPPTNTAAAASTTVDAVEVRLLLLCQAEGLRNRYTNLAGYEPLDDNSGLTALGWEQANLLAAWLKTHEKIDVLVSAPQLRSRLTAQRIGQLVGLPVQVRQDLPKFVPDLVQSPGFTVQMPRYASELHTMPIPEDEPYRLFHQQVIAAVDQVLHEHWGKSIAVVMNGVAVAATLRHFLGAQLLPIVISHTGVSELARSQQRWSLLYVNRREHIPIPAFTPAVVASAAPPPEEKNRETEELNRIVELYNNLALSSTISPLVATKTPPDKISDKLLTERLQRLRALLKFAHLSPNLSILDVGTGNGHLALELAQEGASEVIGVDISPAMLEAAEYLRMDRASPGAQRVVFRLAAAHSLPFADNRFDVCICHMLLHHSQKPATILQEVMRVLKPGGVMILAELLGADDPVKRATYNAIEERRNPAHAQIRSAEQIRKLLLGAGLVIESEKTIAFERELEEWLGEYLVEINGRETVRKMVEASIETDAASLNVRKQAGKLVIDQRLLYVRANKK